MAFPHSPLRIGRTRPNGPEQASFCPAARDPHAECQRGRQCSHGIALQGCSAVDVDADEERTVRARTVLPLLRPNGPRSASLTGPRLSANRQASRALRRDRAFLRRLRRQASSRSRTLRARLLITLFPRPAPIAAPRHCGLLQLEGQTYANEQPQMAAESRNRSVGRR